MEEWGPVQCWQNVNGDADKAVFEAVPQKGKHQITLWPVN